MHQESSLTTEPCHTGNLSVGAINSVLLQMLAALATRLTGDTVATHCQHFILCSTGGRFALVAADSFSIGLAGSGLHQSNRSKQGIPTKKTMKAHTYHHTESNHQKAHPMVGNLSGRGLPDRIHCEYVQHHPKQAHRQATSSKLTYCGGNRHMLK